MSVKIRLARFGAKKEPFYRVVVADSECPRNGKFLETVGTYNPLLDPAEVSFKNERIKILGWSGCHTYRYGKKSFKKRWFFCKF